MSTFAITTAAVEAAEARSRAKIAFNVILAQQKRAERAAEEHRAANEKATRAAKMEKMRKHMHEMAVLKGLVDVQTKLVDGQKEVKELVIDGQTKMVDGQKEVKELVEDGQTKMADDHKKVVDGQTALLRTARKARNIDHVKEEQKYADNETLILDQINLLNYQLGQLNDKLEQARTNHADYLVEWNAAETPPPAAVSTNVTTVSTMKLSRAPTVGLCGSPSAVNPNPQ